MDRQARKLANPRDDSDDDLGGSGNSDSDFENSKGSDVSLYFCSSDIV